jgi:hypothetical protein
MREIIPLYLQRGINTTSNEGNKGVHVMLGKGAKTNISYRNHKRLATIFALLLLVTTALGMVGNTADHD